MRAGRHCAPMAVDAIGAPEGTIRISFGLLNREEDVDRIANAIDSFGS
jgi:selenocysteine lyase/cysteine desulfurase